MGISPLSRLPPRMTIWSMPETTALKEGRNAA